MATIPKGTIYHEHHNRGGKRQTRFHIWCAEITVNGKRHRKRSMNFNECQEWLNEFTKNVYLQSNTQRVPVLDKPLG